MSEWIKTSDKLPEIIDYERVITRRVLVYGVDGGIIFTIGCFRKTIDGWVVNLEDGYIYNIKYITYWMPLPEPPKGDNN